MYMCVCVEGNMKKQSRTIASTVLPDFIKLMTRSLTVKKKNPSFMA